MPAYSRQLSGGKLPPDFIADKFLTKVVIKSDISVEIYEDMDKDIEQLLSEMGLTNLEATIYIALLQYPEITGYKIANIIGKPRPNSYKALDSLLKKGIIIADDTSGKRLFSALPIDDYLDRLEHNFKERRRKIEDSLKPLEIPLQKDGIFSLENVDQVYAKAAQILREAQKIVIVEGFEVPLTRIKDSLEYIAAKGVTVFVKAYWPIEIKGCQVIVAGHEGKLEHDWPWDTLNIVVDSEEFLLSLLKHRNTGIYQSFWSKNRFLAYTIFSGLAQEILFVTAENMLAENMTSKELSVHLAELKKVFISGLMSVSKIF